MSIKKDASGRRSIQVEIEVPGTPEQVWQAIATGPGISSWFVPARTDEKEGGDFDLSFGPGMDVSSKLTVWDPPRRFVADSPGMDPSAPSMANEWTVEAKSGGTCVVRVVNSLFASTDDWDDQLTGLESGWPAFFVILRLYMTDYANQPSAGASAMTMAQAHKDQVWKTLGSSLGIANWNLGEVITSTKGPSRLHGKVVWSTPNNSTVLHLDEPTTGAMAINVCGMGEQSMPAITFYFYGAEAEAVAAREQELWQKWITETFAVPSHA